VIAFELFQSSIYDKTESINWGQREYLTFFWQVKITARDMESLEKSKTIIANLTMVPKVGEIFRCIFVLSLVLCAYNYCFL
jgi:hypothetical protein